MKKVVFVNQSANYLAEDIVKAMLAKGDCEEVVMMVGNPENLVISDPRVKIDPICRYDRSSFKARALSWVKGTMQIQKRLLTIYRDHELFLVSNPPTACFVTMLAKNPYTSLIYDVYPDGLVSDKFLTKNNPVIKMWGAFNRKFFRKAQKVFTITEGMADRLSAYIDRERIEVVPIWYNGTLRRINREENDFIKGYHLEDKFVVMYSGNIGKGHNVKLLPEIANLLRDNERVMFVIIGEGWEKQAVIDRVQELGLKNVMILPRQPLEFISHSLSAADLSYISVNGWASTVSVPSKTYNSLFLGSPLLCVAEPNSEIARIVNNNDVGKTFRETEIQRIADFISEVSSDNEKLSELKHNAIKLSDKFSSKNATKIA